jgi:outer membrane PBP1 activator LpoA protein
MRATNLKSILILALVLGLNACQTPIQTGTGVGVESEANQPEDILTTLALEQEEAWLDAAEAYQVIAQKYSHPEKSRFYIRAGLMLYKGENHHAVEPYFETLQPEDITEQDQNYRATILAGSFLGIGKVYQSLLALPKIGEIEDFEYKALALNIRSRGILMIGKPMDSVRLRIQIDQYLTTIKETEKNHQFIWDALNRISESSIISALSEQQTSEMRGWLELNLIARRSNMLPAKMEPWLSQWYQLYDQHSAGPYFAVNLLEESRRIYIKPTRIALMLPFSGRLSKVGEAIQNGFLYAYYQDKELNAELEIIDASADPSEFRLQYRQAILDGADFVVGPINKDLVDMLQNQESLDVPTLTLNYAKKSSEATLNLYQFGLNPEDEAGQIADIALSEGRNHAITLVPDTEWGARLEKAFSQRFESLGGRVVGAESYPSKKNDYSASIKKLLNLTPSNQRHSILQRVIGQPVSFDPRRRQDVDMVFIAANSRQARLIKPQLKFHRALTLPVYATSHISSTNGNSDDDRDLNGIQFLDIPWLLDNSKNSDYREISQLWPSGSKRLGRLYALGIDAYRLIPALRRLMINPGESELRNTGQLTVDKYGRVKRSLLLATYEKGLPMLLEQPENSGDLSIESSKNTQ